MARLFDDAQTQYLQIEQAVLGVPPFSMAAWFNCNDTTDAHDLLWVGDKDQSTYYSALVLANSAESNYIRCYSHQYSNDRPGGQAFSTLGYTPNLWQHAAGVWAAPDEKYAYLNGGNKGSYLTQTGTVEGHDRTVIGAFRDTTPAAPMSGAIAHAAMWSIALTDPEVALLATGISPLLVRPQNLVAYWPLTDNDEDYFKRYSMIPYANPSWAAGPPKVLDPRRRLWPGQIPYHRLENART